MFRGGTSRAPSPTGRGGERRLSGLKGEPLIHRKRSPFSAGEGLKLVCVGNGPSGTPVPTEVTLESKRTHAVRPYGVMHIGLYP